MNIQIWINVNTVKWYSDAFLSTVIMEILRFVRYFFPEMKANRMDSPVIVHIRKLDEVVEP